MPRLETRLTLALLASTALTGLPQARAAELPSGASVAHGAVSIAQPNANALAITQSSPNAIVNWQGFSIGQNARVDIAQPSASSAMLNRVTGSTPSTIAGQLNANGQVFLVNPNGIAITSSGTVRAGAFVASTLGMADEDFKAGRRTFSGTGASAAVSNRGRIEIGRGGYAALLGGEVDNSGVISVPMGKVGLGAGERATLDLSGDGFLQVSVPSSGTASDRALIQQSGQIRAAGGRVEIRAATARDAARQVINVSGIVEARSVGGRSGAIVLGGGAGGGVTVSGRLNVGAASGRRAARASQAQPTRGGAITITGNDVRLAGAKLDASGTAGGGTIRIGGDYQGRGALQRAETTRVDAATTISADALGSGDGGSIVLWSDLRTTFAGSIFARGGEAGGDGGSAEVSGKALLAYGGLADLTAARGRWGTLLLDPFNVFITNGGTAGGTLAGGAFTPTANDSVLNAAELGAALNTANVTVTTGGAGSPGAQAGDIAVQANVSWTAPTALTLSAFRDINVGNTTGPSTTITVPTGGVVNLRADNSGTGVGTVMFTSQSTPGGGGFIATSTGSTVSIYYNPASNPAGSPINPTSYTSPQSFVGGGPTGGIIGPGALTAYMLVNNLNDLQNIQNNLAGSYALGRNIDASTSAGLNAGAGFDPLGQNNDPAFSGIFDGLGQTITGLTINRPAEANVGLFGAASGSRITNVALAGLNVAGGDNTGGLVGFASGLAVSGASVAGRVAGGNTTGGLVGAQLGGSVTASSSAATVSGTDNVGGLVGVMDGGTLSLSSASGPVSGGSQVGGLVGIGQSSTIIRSFANGAVTGTDLVGGLIGGFGGEGASLATGILAESFANGAVTSQNRGGGLIGLVSNGSQIRDSFATGLTSGGTAAGGLIGEINSVPAPGGSAAPADIVNTYATGLVLGAGARGGLVGNVVGSLQSITTSYYDTQTTGLTTSAGPGGTGLTTAQLQGTLPPGFTSPPWGAQANAYPFLLWRFPAGVLAVSGIVRAAADPGTPIPAEPVRLAAGQTLSYQTNSGASGYYYFSVDPLTGAAPQGATAFLNGANRGSSSSDAPSGAGAIPGLDIRVGRAQVRTGQTSSSGLGAILSSAGDSSLSAAIPYTVPVAPAAVAFGPAVSLAIEAQNAGGFTIDRSIVANGPVLLTGNGPTASAGPVTVAAGQTLQSQTGDLVLATTQFTNNAGATGLQAGGRYLVYSNDYALDNRGGLPGGNLYNRTFGGNPPGAITQPGNQFIFVRQPTLTFSATDEAREYANLPSFTSTPTLAGLVNGDTAAQALTGAPVVADTTSVTTGVGTFPGAVQVAQGSVVATDVGYALAFQNAPLTIRPAPLTVQARNVSKVYGDTLAVTGTEFLPPTGLRNTDQVSSVTLSSPGAPAAATVSGSPYPITPSDAQGTGLTNYTISYAPGALSVTPAPLTITARDATKPFGQQLTFAGTEFNATGLRNADRVTSVTLTSPGAPAAATAEGSPYPITASNPQGTGLAAAGVSNYVFSFAPGALTVTAAPPPPPPPGRADQLAQALAQPTLSRQLPDFSFPINAALDTIDLSGGGGGPTLGTGAGPRIGRETAADTLGFVQRSSDDLQRRIDECERRRPLLDEYKDCVSSALEQYAQDLDTRILQLPPPLRAVTAIIREAARTVRAARTIVEARASVRTAVAEVRKAIALIRADEPAVGRLQVRQGNAIASALQSVDTKLARAVGL